MKWLGVSEQACCFPLPLTSLVISEWSRHRPSLTRARTPPAATTRRCPTSTLCMHTACYGFVGLLRPSYIYAALSTQATLYDQCRSLHLNAYLCRAPNTTAPQPIIATTTNLHHRHRCDHHYHHRCRVTITTTKPTKFPTPPPRAPSRSPPSNH